VTGASVGLTTGKAVKKVVATVGAGDPCPTGLLVTGVSVTGASVGIDSGGRVPCPLGFVEIGGLVGEGVGAVVTGLRTTGAVVAPPEAREG